VWACADYPYPAAPWLRLMQPACVALLCPPFVSSFDLPAGAVCPRVVSAVYLVELLDKEHTDTKHMKVRGRKLGCLNAAAAGAAA